MGKISPAPYLLGCHVHKLGEAGKQGGTLAWGEGVMMSGADLHLQP